MEMMTGVSLRQGRRQAGWTQVRLAARLGVTQAYLSLMEQGKRRIPERVARAAIRLLRLPPTALPLPAFAVFELPVSELWVAQGLSELGYPGFSYRKVRSPKLNPMELLLRALALDNLEPRLTEGLPWLFLRFTDFDFEVLAGHAKLRDLQNRLGFTITMARQVAEHNPEYRHRVNDLRQFEDSLEPSRLVREDSFGRKESSQPMLTWLRKNRSAAASHWNLLTDFKMEDLSYAHQDPGTMAKLSP
jgi:transcriptional regulator with XRE-family HTH domain